MGELLDSDMEKYKIYLLDYIMGKHFAPVEE